MAETACSRCGGSNISFQREETASIGGSMHSLNDKKGHGLFYWIFIGWWLWIFKWMMALCTLGISLLFTRKKKDGIKGKTLTANKTFNRTMAICQDCGNTWKVK